MNNLAQAASILCVTRSALAHHIDEAESIDISQIAAIDDALAVIQNFLDAALDEASKTL